MIESLDHVIIAVNNLEKAEQNYQKILGIKPSWRGNHKEWGTSNSLFSFQNTYLELLAATEEGMGAQLVKNKIKNDGEGLMGIVLGTDDLEAVRNKLIALGFSLPSQSNGEGINTNNNSKRSWVNQFLPIELTRGLFSFIIQHKEGYLPEAKKLDNNFVKKLDHIVIKTNNADSFIDVYNKIFDIRLALDKFIETWKRRMLFFRLNKTTIEVIEEKDESKISQDILWGLAWEVEDISKKIDELIADGTDVSEIKKGVKENTLVATIKSHTHNVPTLLIQYV
jgi:catechol 2,3-dioxygenase-like lactoylglutathione lyase family enzyme/predicted enzyme related to lactoylglutathione lyase